MTAKGLEQREVLRRFADVSLQRHLLVDGANILHAWPESRALLKSDRETARARLVQRLAAIHDEEAIRVTVVFDGRGRELTVEHPSGQSSFSVIYTPSAQTADDVIEQMVANAAEVSACIVATDDRGERETVMALGATVVPADDLATWLREADARQTRKVTAMKTANTRANAPGLSASPAVAELQGLYGPFVFSEKLLQKIWLRGDFDRSHAMTTDGRRVTILHPGRWNLLGGPDFMGAKLRFGEATATIGDVELHLRADDWANHGHAADSAYDGVVLHVVLFPPAAKQVTRGAGDRAIPVLALLPLLYHDLEEYAAEDAVEGLANRPAARIIEVLGPLPQAELVRLLTRHAAERWRQKVHFARLRVQRLGWEEACHQTALEILGYRFNRAPMLRVATLYPLAKWRAPTFSAEIVFEEERSSWSLQGLRPANHPRRRLEQYAKWVRMRPNWPDRLAVLAERLPEIASGGVTGEVRWEHQFTAMRREWESELCGEAVGGTRFDNLVCDGFLPLQAARTTRELRSWWQHWFAGDLPATLPRALRELGVFDGRANPVSHGTVQGLLGWLIERERGESAAAGRGA